MNEIERLKKSVSYLNAKINHLEERLEQLSFHNEYQSQNLTQKSYLEESHS